MQLSSMTGPVAASRAAQPPAGAGDLRLAQMNLWNLFDTVNDPKTGDDDSTPTAEQYQIKLTKIANAITELGTPDVISLNEIENETVLRDLLKQPALQGAGYKFVVQPTNDARGITVGVLYKGDKLELVSQTSVNPKMSFPDGGKGQVDESLLYARPPLVVDFRQHGVAQASEGAGLLTLAINHFKSKRDGEGPEARRQMQGQFLGEWLDARRAAGGTGTTVVLGDLNANYGDGAFEKLAKRPDGSLRFHDAALGIPEADRYTYLFHGQKNLLDHVMIDAGRQDAIVGARIPHLNTAPGARDQQWNADVLAGYSDHDSMVVDFNAAKLFAAG